MSDLGCGHCQESRMLLVTQLIAFWFCLQMADGRVLYRPKWLAEGQCTACKGQANSKQIAKSGSQSINNGISLLSINNGLLHPRHYPRYNLLYLIYPLSSLLLPN